MHPLVIIGPTASGKSALAMDIALKTGAEIISVDSRQIYRRLDIGTAKPSEEDRRKIPHHLIDVLELHERSDARKFAEMADAAVEKIRCSGRLPILVGGSGLYLRALIEGLFEIGLDAAERDAFAESVKAAKTEDLREQLCMVDPESALRIHRNDRYRIIRALEIHSLSGTPLSGHFKIQRASQPNGSLFPCLKIGLNPGRNILHERINLRTLKMLEAGWIAEVEDLLSDAVDPSWPGMQTLGYPDIVSHIRGKTTQNAMIEKISARTRQYAKRQMTWFRKENEVQWLDPASKDTVSAVLKLLDSARIN